MDNNEIARLLSETADLMEIAGEDPFRIRSYRNAAAVIEAHPEPLESLAQQAGRSFTEIPGIGKGLAAALAEILARGSFERRDEMLEKYPPTVLPMLRLQGVGPKTLRALIEHFHISTMDDLERICAEQRLRTLPRMGAKLEEKILRSIQQFRQSAGRFTLDFASGVVQELQQYLGEAVPAGSFRRGKETVGDIDLLVTGAEPAAVLERFAAYPAVKEVLAKGENKASVRVGFEGIQVDLRVLPAESFGAALQYFTGSKEHNVSLRTRAAHRELTLNEYGLFRHGSGERVAGETEEGIYEALGLAWIPPELRENSGEIEAAAAGTLPRLIERSDIRGDLHMHTRESDGRATLEEMAEAARELGYEYIAITDHSKSLAMANGLDEKRAVEFARRVREYNRRNGAVHVFAGLECDIKRDGSMDLSEEALAELDFVVGSVHSYMNIDPREMTDRLLRALESPSLRVLGHPTGRVLLHREAFHFDFAAVAQAAAARGVAFEINASPERLDLHAPLARTAKAKGCRFLISTDAHHRKHLENMRFGVLMARRGWLTAADVLNTLPLEQFRFVLRIH